MVDEVEAAGLEPGATWTWTMGDTSQRCGAAMANVDTATGCTYWASGAETTVFEGSPSLALVAHEVANAETERDAGSGLLSEVAGAEAGTSWSPTDAVASCLVEHFLGFQDGSAGTWQCPPALAASVAAQIHETVSVTQMTATCGTATGASSTLTFTGSGGTLKVTDPSVGSTPQVAAAGVPVTVSGVGVFTAVDTGGTISQSGACAA
jgi:3D (Asp-Asp-Asp) domain-containing protein